MQGASSNREERFESAAYTGVREHFEPIFNAAARRRAACAVMGWTRPTFDSASLIAPAWEVFRSHARKERRAHERDYAVGDRSGKAGFSGARGGRSRCLRPAPAGAPGAVAAVRCATAAVHGGHGSLRRRT